jgi:hypothetical protein
MVFTVFNKRESPRQITGGTGVSPVRIDLDSLQRNFDNTKVSDKISTVSRSSRAGKKAANREFTPAIRPTGNHSQDSGPTPAKGSYHSYTMFETNTWRVSVDPAVRMYQRVQKEPGWVTKTAALAAFLVLVLPLMFLGLLALLTGILVFGTLAFVNKVWHTITGKSLFTTTIKRPDPGDDVRQNVRVLGRD